MGYLLSFQGDVTYNFGPTWYPADRSSGLSIPQSKLPRTHGARQLGGYAPHRKLTIRGGFVHNGGGLGGVANFRTELDNLMQSLNSGAGSLYFGDSTRYYRCCRWESMGESYDPTAWARILQGSGITFVTGDPYQYGAAGADDTWTGPTDATTHVVTVAGGNAPALPTLAITVGGAGSQSIQWTLTNLATSEAFTLYGTVTGGDVITLNSLLKSCYIGLTDKATLFDGQFLSLNVGTNTLSIDIDAGTITSIATSWITRYF